MQMTRFVRALGLMLGLGVGGSVVGCGSGSQQAALAEQEESGKIRAESHKAFHEHLKETKSNAPDPRQGRGPRRSLN
jgi:hypothetical protein